MPKKRVPVEIAAGEKVTVEHGGNTITGVAAGRSADGSLIIKNAYINVGEDTVRIDYPVRVPAPGTGGK